MKPSEPIIKFLREQGENTKFRFKDSGKPTPKDVMDTWRLLSMIEVLLPENLTEAQIKRLEGIVDFK